MEQYFNFAVYYYSAEMSARYKPLAMPFLLLLLLITSASTSAGDTPRPPTQALPLSRQGQPSRSTGTKQSFQSIEAVTLTSLTQNYRLNEFPSTDQSNKVQFHSSQFIQTNSLNLQSNIPASPYRTARRRVITQPPKIANSSQEESPPRGPPGFFQSSQIGQDQLVRARQWRSLVFDSPQVQTDKAASERNYYQSKYRIGQYEQLPFCIVVPIYNNAQHDRHLNNIRSILMQNYTNFHIVILDDASTDGTGYAILAQLKSQNRVSRERWEMIINEQRTGALHNIRRAAGEFCQAEEVLVVVDGDDELIGRQVLKLFNSVFHSSKAWFVYSNFLSASKSALGYSRPFSEAVMKRNGYRSYPFVASHLRAYYTQLLRNVREKDLRDEEGSYFTSANDVAICMPILEQAHTRVKYIPEITYYYNDETGNNNHFAKAVEQTNNQRRVRDKPSYLPLAKLFEDQ